jgi:lactoylglutathione lyase
MKPNLKQAVPFFTVKNMDASIAFYVDGLGFEMKIDWKPRGRIEWCYLQRDETALMLQEYRTELAPDSKVGVGISICFMCDDAIAFYHEVVNRGLPASRPFVGNNLWVTSLQDPDGYRLDFESPTDVPEGTEYAG